MNASPGIYSRPSLVLPDESCAAFLARIAGSAPGRPALVDDDGRRWTLGNLREAVAGAAHLLGEVGAGRGDRVVLSLATGADYFIWAFAILERGAVVVPVYENAPQAEFRTRVEAAGARVAVVAADAPGDRSGCVSGGSILVEASRWREHAGRPLHPTPVGPDDPAFLFYSSGSTGEPKAIPLTHRNILAGRLAFTQATLLCPQDVLLHFLPPVHIYGWMAVTAALGAGASVALHSRYDFERIVEDVRRYRATAVFGVPRLVVDLAEIAPARAESLRSLRFVNTGSAPLSPEIMRQVTQRTGIAVTCGYGLTEAAPISHSPVDRPDLADPASVGCAVSLTSLRLVDPDDPDRPAPPGAAGELVVSGPQVAAGYLRPDGSLDRCAWLGDGAFRTGDLVEIDEIGRLRIVGRLKSLIKYNGYSIVPAEIEALLARHPDVRDCAVLGRSDPVAGEIPVAFVVPRGRDHVPADDIITFVRAAVSAQRCVRSVVFVETIPRSEAGKVIARELLDMA